MRIDLIESLHFYKLRDTADRRGPIVSLKVQDIPNRDYALTSAAAVLNKVICLLDSTYNDMSNSAENIGFGAYLPGFGEQNSCWINEAWPRQDGGHYGIIVQHKYWGDHQIAAFKRIMRTLAALHGWQVTEDEEEER